MTHISDEVGPKGARIYVMFCGGGRVQQMIILGMR
jgi:hypothetical protein